VDGVRTRLRVLRVGDLECAWTAKISHVRGESDCHRVVQLCVWGAGKNSQRLEVDLLSNTPSGPWAACATDNTFPTPRDVRAVVDYALLHGWETGRGREVFLLTESEHAGAFELTDFLITDRLRNPDAPDPSARVASAASRAREAG
jgi:hypothetical protein